jgi:ligand-binding sensor domain-containing protein
MLIYRKLKWLGMMICLLTAFQIKAEITFTPANPIVEMENKISLSVSGTVGALIWTAQNGFIEGSGTTVTYIAPSQAGWDMLMVTDAEANVATLKIEIKEAEIKEEYLSENIVWKVFINRDNIQALALSKDKTTLWVGTNGGLEKRNASTGELEQVYTNVDGMPSNDVHALLIDEQGGIWIGTDRGLAQLKSDDKSNASWAVFHTDNSNLPSNTVNALLSDTQGGIWIGTSMGLAHLKFDDSWAVFNTDNSNLPSNHVETILLDEQGGLWVGTGGNVNLSEGGLAHIKADGSWEVFKTNNSKLPRNSVKTLLLDGQGGLWVGTAGIPIWGEGGLAHLKADGSWQEALTTAKSSLPSNQVEALLSDEQGGIWIGTGDKGINPGGLAHLNDDGSWQVFKPDKSKLPFNAVNILLSDEQGGVWVGTDKGLAHLKADASWQYLNTNKLKIPSNQITTLVSDQQGGFLVGTDKGLAHLKKDRSWEVFNTDKLTLPHNKVEALLLDEQADLWVGTENGLAHTHIKEGIKAEPPWQVFNKDNSNLPNNQVSSLLSDKQGGVWIGTNGSGLAHLKAYASWQIDASWQIFNKSNSDMPSDSVTTLVSDEQGGVWVSTQNGGLAHIKVEGSWEVFNTNNSSLPSNTVNALLSDKQGGVWIATQDKGLAHLKASWPVFNESNSNQPSNSVKTLLSEVQGRVGVRSSRANTHIKTWDIFNKDNSNLPSNEVKTLISDAQGGIWIGTDKGLVHLKKDHSWQIFNKDNSNLPDNEINALLSETEGEVWFGTQKSGLVHLKLEEQESGMRAAIIIAGGGNQSDNILWDTTESISSYFYKMLKTRKFVHSEIYYLSPQFWADFNGDGINDKIVDAPDQEGSLNLDDIKKAFEWAKEQGKLDQPLYVFFIDHGGEGRLQLDKNTNMSAEEFKAILDEYQQATGNQLVVILEACFSGSFLPILQAPNRAIISSTKANEKAYFEDKKGFSHFFSKNLMKGMDFLDAFKRSVQQQGILLNKMDVRLAGASAESEVTTQTPQFDDTGDGVYNASDGQWLKQLQMNGNFLTGDFTLAVESLTASGSVQVGQPFSLSAKASTASGHVRRVWAVIRPPRMNLVIDSNGTPILAYPTQELSQTEEQTIWTGSWNQAVYNGDYEISFYTKDNEGNIEISEESVVISVSGGVEPPAEASVEIVIEKDRYARGESFKFELVEELGWGYDLYAAVVLPDGQFITLEGPNDFAQLNQATKWGKTLKYHENVTAIDLTLPPDLAVGTYCLYGILSPQGDDPLLVQDKWVSSQQCFEVR